MNKVLLKCDCYLLGNSVRKNTFCNEPREEIGPLAGFKESVWEFKERPGKGCMLDTLGTIYQVYHTSSQTSWF